MIATQISHIADLAHDIRINSLFHFLISLIVSLIVEYSLVRHKMTGEKTK